MFSYSFMTNCYLFLLYEVILLSRIFSPYGISDIEPSLPVLQIPYKVHLFGYFSAFLCGLNTPDFYITM